MSVTWSLNEGSIFCRETENWPENCKQRKNQEYFIINRSLKTIVNIILKNYCWTILRRPICRYWSLHMQTCVCIRMLRVRIKRLFLSSRMLWNGVIALYCGLANAGALLLWYSRKKRANSNLISGRAGSGVPENPIFFFLRVQNPRSSNATVKR